MYKTFLSLLTIVWVLDVLNLPFMEFLDTAYPVNTLAWLIIWLFIPVMQGYVEIVKPEVIRGHNEG